MIEVSRANEPLQRMRLQRVMERLGADAGSLHAIDTEESVLKLVCAVGLPEALLTVIQTIPKGKGLAGAAWSQRATVESCALESDPIVGHSARSLAFLSNFAVPIFKDKVLVGVVGVAFVDEHILSSDAHKLISDTFADGLYDG